MAEKKQEEAEKPNEPGQTAEAPDIPGNGPGEPEKGGFGTAARKRLAAVLPRILKKAVRYGIFACLGILVVGVGIWLAIVIPEFQKRAAPVPVRSPEEIARDKEARVKEAEKTATWQNAHCKLLHAYYDGTEPDLPLAELIGLPADADDARIEERCGKLLDAVHHLGGWPTAKPQQDNFVVCTGFRFELTGSFPFSVRVTPESLAADTVLFGRPGNEIHTQKILPENAVAIGSYTPVIVRANDDCVVIGEKRLGRRRAIPGRIVRDAEAAEKPQQP